MEQYSKVGNLAWMHSAHNRWCNNTSNALSFACECFCFLVTSPSFTPFFSPPLSRHHFCFSVSLCARACIWHLSDGLRVMPWSCHKLGHRSMYAVRCPVRGIASLRMSSRATGHNATTGVFLLTLVCPKNNKLSPFPLQLGCISENSSWNTTSCACNKTAPCSEATVGGILLSCNAVL